MQKQKHKGNSEKGFDKSLSEMYDGLTGSSYYSMFFDSIFYYLNETEIKGKSHLDIGCGNGKLCQQFVSKEAKNTVGLDISAEQIKIANSLHGSSQYSFKVQNAYEAFYMGESFEIVTCIYSLHFIENYKTLVQACRNIKKHVKKDGIAIILDITHDYVYDKEKMQALKDLTMYEYRPNIEEGQVPLPWQKVEGLIHTEKEILKIDHIAIHGKNLIKALEEVGFKKVKRKQFVHPNKFYTDLWGEKGFNHHLLFCN